MPKKPTNSIVKSSESVSGNRGEFVRQLAVDMLLTLVATNGKLNSDQPGMVVDIANELADNLKL